jgi:hypothetical protein
MPTTDYLRWSWPSQLMLSSWEAREVSQYPAQSTLAQKLVCSRLMLTAITLPYRRSITGACPSRARGTACAELCSYLW